MPAPPASGADEGGVGRRGGRETKGDGRPRRGGGSWLPPFVYCCFRFPCPLSRSSLNSILPHTFTSPYIYVAALSNSWGTSLPHGYPFSCFRSHLRPSLTPNTSFAIEPVTSSPFSATAPLFSSPLLLPTPFRAAVTPALVSQCHCPDTPCFPRQIPL